MVLPAASSNIWVGDRAPSVTILANGLTHYYKMEEGAGSRVDQVGGASWTVGAGAPAAIIGKSNFGASLSQGNTLTLATNSLLSSSFTLACWIQITSKNNATLDSPIFGSTGASGGFDFIFPVADSSPCKLTVYPSANITVFPSVIFPDSNFHAIIIWGDRNTTSIQYDLGSPRNILSPVGLADTLTLSWPVSTGASFVMDEMAVWNRVLNSDERQFWYNAGTGRFYPY